MSKNNDTIITGTEARLDQSCWIDRLGVDAALSVQLESQAGAAQAVQRALPDILTACHTMHDRLAHAPAGRLIYSGAGTSARIGVQDGAELLPTFNWPQDRVTFMIAGGRKALFEAVENAEDDTVAAEAACNALTIGPDDCLIAVGASGRTPYTIATVIRARQKGALTIGISNNPDTRLLSVADISICLDTGAEALAGSTRLAAGTAQKICLNLLSTQVMVMLGRVKNGLMSEMVPRNEKLRHRKTEIDQALS